MASKLGVMYPLGNIFDVQMEVQLGMDVLHTFQQMGTSTPVFSDDWNE